MRDRRHVPLGVRVRLALGAGLGIFGLGQMGRSVLPFHALDFAAGVVCLAAGAFLTIGLMTARGGA
jgi:hypothetical protein